MFRTEYEHARGSKGSAMGVWAILVLSLLAFPCSSPSHELGGHHGEQATEDHDAASKVLEIVMADGRYRVFRQGQEISTRQISLEAGQEAVFVLRNRDTVPHEFITPLFTRTEVHFSGDATGIFGREAAGFRLAPGKALLVWMKMPFSDPFTTMYEVAWCTMHDATPSEGTRQGGQELLIVATRENVSS